MVEVRWAWLICWVPAATDIMVEELILRPPHLAQRVRERSVESAAGREEETLLVRLLLRGW